MIFTIVVPCLNIVDMAAMVNSDHDELERIHMHEQDLLYMSIVADSEPDVQETSFMNIASESELDEEDYMDMSTDWNWLIQNKWETKEFKDRSETNRRNGKKVVMSPTLGCKTYIEATLLELEESRRRLEYLERKHEQQWDAFMK